MNYRANRRYMATGTSNSSLFCLGPVVYAFAKAAVAFLDEDDGCCKPQLGLRYPRCRSVYLSRAQPATCRTVVGRLFRHRVGDNAEISAA
jgi:hypothetical protein